MKVKILSVFIFAGMAVSMFGQITEGEKNLRKHNADTIEGWKKGGFGGVNLSQTSLVNWASGGENSITVNGLLGIFANYKKGKNAWDNSLDIGYGLLKQGTGSGFIKTDDRFDLTSKYGRQAGRNIYYAALMNFKTQLSVGKDYAKDTAKISNFLSPAYLLTALGMDYKPTSYLSTFIAPVTGKMTIVNDQELADKGAFGVQGATYDDQDNLLTHGKKTKSELGGYIRAIYSKNDFKNEWLKNLSITSKLDLFSNYLKHPEQIDVSWENMVIFKVNKYISVNINTHLIYDADILFADEATGEMIPKVQFKEILGVGFLYKF